MRMPVVARVHGNFPPGRPKPSVGEANQVQGGNDAASLYSYAHCAAQRRPKEN
jgi:hypothetical protein